MSRDIPHEARELVKRMHADPMVNVSADWKVRLNWFGRGKRVL